MTEMEAEIRPHPAWLADLSPVRPASTEVRPFRKVSRIRSRRGITLVELMVAMAIIALMMAIAFPSVTAGLDGIRLRTDIDRAGTFFSQARLTADLRQQPVQLTADPKTRELRALSADGRWEDSLAFSDNVQIAFPQQEQNWVLHPGTPAPRFRLLLASERGRRSGLSINIFTGVAEDWSPAEENDR